MSAAATAATAAGSGGGGGVRPARQRDVIAARARVKEKRVRPPSEALSLSPLYNVESVGAVVGPVAAATAVTAAPAAAFSRRTALLVVWLVCSRPGLLLESALLHSSGT